MKKIIAILLLSFINCSLYAQSTETIAQEIQKHFNHSDYDSLYDLLAPEFQNQFPKKEHHEFYKSNIKEVFGQIQAIKFVSDSAKLLTYIVNFEKGKLYLMLYLEKDEKSNKLKISSLQWLPFDRVSDAKRDISSILSDNKKQTPIDKKIDSLALTYLENSSSCGISIGVIKGDNIQFYNYGEVKRGSLTLPGKNTLYEIGSITKVFTGIILANAVREKKLGLEDDIRKYLGGGYKNLEYEAHPIKIKHLCSHTSLLPAIPDNIEKQNSFSAEDPYKNYTKEMLKSYLQGVKIDTVPGTRYEYSNLGMAVLTLLLENVYKTKMSDLYRKFITKPLNMNSTSIFIDDTVNFAKGHSEIDGKVVGYWNLNAFEGAGALKSNANDMVKFMRANMLENNEAIALSHKSTYENASIKHGIAWVISSSHSGSDFIWHNGRTAGFSSVCGFVKDKKVGMVVLSNSGLACDQLGFEIIKLLMKQ